MKREEVVEVLRQIPLFEALPKAELRRIARFARTRHYATGEIIIREGEVDDRLFVVLAGEVKVVRDYQGPRERILGFLGPGMCFGEMALLDNYERTATVVANVDALCLEVRHPDFMGLLESYPRLALALLRVLARRLRQAQSLL
jgi:CRP-like cAMP-binding protein